MSVHVGHLIGFKFGDIYNSTSQ